MRVVLFIVLMALCAIGHAADSDALRDKAMESIAALEAAKKQVTADVSAYNASITSKNLKLLKGGKIKPITDAEIVEKNKSDLKAMQKDQSKVNHLNKILSTVAASQKIIRGTSDDGMKRSLGRSVEASLATMHHFNDILLKYRDIELLTPVKFDAKD